MNILKYYSSEAEYLIVWNWNSVSIFFVLLNELRSNKCASLDNNCYSN